MTPAWHTLRSRFPATVPWLLATRFSRRVGLLPADHMVDSLTVGASMVQAEPLWRYTGTMRLRGGMEDTGAGHRPVRVQVYFVCMAFGLGPEGTAEQQYVPCAVCCAPKTNHVSNLSYTCMKWVQFVRSRLANSLSDEQDRSSGVVVGFKQLWSLYARNRLR